jgi:hypothetical protein
MALRDWEAANAVQPATTTSGGSTTAAPEDVVPPTGVTSDEVLGIVQGFYNQQNTANTETATSILQSVLKFYGMEDPQLVTDVRTALAERRLTGTSTVDDIGIQLRESAAFKDRFAGNEARRAAGKPAYSVSQYLQLESSYRNTMLAAGLPSSFYDGKEDFANFIANDVSPDEIQDRVSKGFAAINNAPQNVIDEFQTLYGVDKNELAAYFLDPVRAKEIVIRKAEAAKIASQARQQANISLGATQAELLAQQGITEQQAQTGFGLVLQGQKLTQPLQGEEALTQEELIAGTFGTNAAAAQRVAQTRRKRKGTFESGGTLAAAKVQQENIGLSTVGQ